jgi:hypothetical protein
MHSCKYFCHKLKVALPSIVGRSPRTHLSFATVAGVVCAAVVAMIMPVAPVSAQSSSVQINVLSNRANLLSGGDALIEVAMPQYVNPSNGVKIFLNGRIINGAFAIRPNGRYMGLVTGLVNGDNNLTVVSVAGRAQTTLTNHPITGPVFSGPHQTPFVCETAALGLGDPVDSDCSAPTRVDYFYRSTTSNTFQPYSSSGPPPADLATTTTRDGVVVPYIVRREMGTINRAVYVVDILHDPATPLPTPYTGSPGYNGRLVYSFGGGCMAGYHQGRSVGGFDTANFLEEAQVGYQDYFLSKGYAVIGASLNVTGNTCADVISAETAMMVKEHFIEEYGVPRYTIGAGGSGGSMQQHLLGNNYPGLLDGIMPGRSFPDQISFLNPLFDCELLANVVNTSSLTWTQAQKTAVTGEQDFAYCTSNGARYPNLRPTNCNAVSIPPSLVYNPVSNPGGARCTYQDNLVNVFGIDPVTGFARRPFDNVGIQYGLTALNAGAMTFEQFIDVNARIGGHDIDGHIVANRTVGDPVALQLAYETGRVNEFGAGLASTPIIDVRSYLDYVPGGSFLVDVHNSYHSRVARARLIASNGNAANQVIVTTPNSGGGCQTAGSSVCLIQDVGNRSSPLSIISRRLFDSMDQWLANIANDSGRNGPEKTIRNKPADLVDSCYDQSLQKITDPAQCEQIYPKFNDPRLVAGAPAADDVFKCTLKPVDSADYLPPLSAAQLNVVRSVFPSGVCDWTKSPVGKVPLADTWLSYPQPGTFSGTQ